MVCAHLELVVVLVENSGSVSERGIFDANENEDQDGVCHHHAFDCVADVGLLLVGR